MSKVNREQKFNQEFVQYLKEYKCLYDYTCPEYKNRELHAQAWAELSAKCGEPEQSCRKRWRNLKTSTSRYLKQLRSSNNELEHKPYYLYDDMKFIIPFMRNRVDLDSSVNVGVMKTEMKTEVFESEKEYEYELITNDEGDYIVQGPTENESEAEVENIITIEKDPDDEPKEHSADDADDASNPSVEKKPRLSFKEAGTYTVTDYNPTVNDIPLMMVPKHNSNNDEMFLRSLLPDINSMTTDQKRKFKIEVLKLIDNILTS